MKQTLCIMCLTLLLCRYGWAQPITFGIVPQQSAVDLAHKWSPVLNDLASVTSLDIQFRTAKDVPTFEQHLVLGDYDVAFMTPFQYTSLPKNSPYRAFVKASDTPINGLIVVNKDSDIHTLADLKYMTLAFPSSKRSAATWIMQRELKNSGISFYSRYVSSDESVYLNVLKGFYPAGAGIQHTWEQSSMMLKENLRVLWISRDYPTYVFAHNTGLSATTVTSVQNALLQLSNTAQGLSQLKALGLSPLISAQHSDWGSIRHSSSTHLPGIQLY
ncbi:MAG: phosphate/phosphite/phosphonate ABC transporter substrate-binding protein [Vibrio sp.]